jgi:hypothetical protein
VDDITGTFWKIKWAIKVEEEVAKLKAAIGPQLVAIGVLLQVKDLEQNAAACQDITQLLSLTQHATSGIDMVWLAVQDQGLATRRIDLRTLDIHRDTQTIVQQLPQLATSRQLDNAVLSIEDISVKVDSTATKDQVDELKDQVDELESLLQTASIAPETMAASERHETQILQMVRKIQDIHNLLVAMRPPDHSGPPNLGQVFANQLQRLLSTICRLLVSAVVAMVLVLPNIQLLAASRLQHLLSMFRSLLENPVTALLRVSPNVDLQLRRFTTFLKSPGLLLDSRIILTDALGRISPLSYDHFSHWNVLHEWLVYSFKGLPGESRVRRGEFEMFVLMGNKTRHVPRGGDGWERFVFPGDRVVMSIFSTRVYRGQCIRCDHVISYQVDTTDWIEW